MRTDCLTSSVWFPGRKLRFLVSGDIISLACLDLTPIALSDFNHKLSYVERTKSLANKYLGKERKNACGMEVEVFFLLLFIT